MSRLVELQNVVLVAKTQNRFQHSLCLSFDRLVLFHSTQLVPWFALGKEGGQMKVGGPKALILKYLNVHSYVEFNKG